MKKLEDLPKDIYALFKSGKKFSEENIKAFGTRLAEHISNRISDEKDKPTLRMSNLGSACRRQLWYSINAPEVGEPLPPQASMKFLFGDILEELILFLAKEAGHEVTGQQDELELNGVKGHRDGIIDGITCDIKSAASFSFNKFKEGLRKSVDNFGYLVQLGSYREARKRAEGTSKPAAFVAIDKQLGHICVDIHDKDLDQDYDKLIDSIREDVNRNSPPDRGFDAIPDGKSGNYKLGTVCSYCSYKKACYPGLRTFLYSDGPRHLVRVEREPNVPEAK